MKRPSFQFYPCDWQGNTKLRRCSHVEKGVWIDVMCLMHDAEAYGILLWPLKDISQAVGCKVSELRSLKAKGVLKGADTGEYCDPYVYTPRHAGKDGEPVNLIHEQNGPIWYSSRMVVDEYVRQKRGAGTRFDTTPKDIPEATPEAIPKGDFGYGSTSSSAYPLKEKSTKKESTGDQYTESFQVFWDKYPLGRKGNKDKAYSAWNRAIKRAPDTQIIIGLEAYCQSSQAQQYPKGAESWLNDDRWAWDYTSLETFNKKPVPKIAGPQREVV